VNAKTLMASFLRVNQAAVLALVVLALCLYPSIGTTDQAQYFYDELGQLVGVVDGQGNAAVYNYDEVGNLLAIQRFTAGSAGIGIFLLAPPSALVGATVEMRGFGFSATPSNNQVAFNGTPAAVVSATANSLSVMVPTGATTGPVTVTNANGSATSPQPFTVVTITITGLEPSRVAQGTSTLAVITGTHLAGATDVQFTQSGLSVALLAGATAQRLPISLAAAATVPPGAYPFSVTTPAGVVASGAVTVTVAPAMPTADPVRPLSVFKPFPPQVAPSGDSQSVAPPVSVGKP